MDGWIGVSNGIISARDVPSFLPSLVTHRGHGFSPDTTSGLSVSRSTAGARSIEGGKGSFGRFIVPPRIFHEADSGANLRTHVRACVAHAGYAARMRIDRGQR